MSGLSALNVGVAVASAATITASNKIFHVTGVAEITTINPPANFSESQITIIPDGIFTTAIGGNIGLASIAVVGKALVLTWDGVHWYPSY